MTTPTRRPRTVATDAGARVNTGRARPSQSTRSPRFRHAFALSVDQVQSALESADAIQLARAADCYGFVQREATFRCPACDQKQAAATSRWIWACEACGQQGSWIALREIVARDVESVCRLAEIVHGVKVGRPAGDAS